MEKKYQRFKDFKYKNQFLLRAYAAYHLGEPEDIEQDQVLAYYIDEQIDELVQQGENQKALQKFKTSFRKQVKNYATSSQRIEEGADYDEFLTRKDDAEYRIKLNNKLKPSLEESIINDIELKRLTQWLTPKEYEFLLDCETYRRKDVLEIYGIDIKEYNSKRNHLIWLIREGIKEL